MTKLAAIHEPFVAYHAPAGMFNHGTMTPVRIILHDTECHDAAGISEIEGVVHFWGEATPGNRLGSHYLVDRDGNIGKLADGTVLLYHVGGLNSGSVGIEQIGFASFTEKDWIDRPAQLDKVARLLAYLHTEYGIPLTVPTDQGDGKPMHGVMTHAMVSRFEPASEGHTDPGSGYPLAHVLSVANGYVKAGGWAKPGETPKPAKPKPAKRTVIDFTTRKYKPGTITVTGNPFLYMATHNPRAWRRGPVHMRPKK